jgi:hypothetical protein
MLSCETSARDFEYRPMASAPDRLLAELVAFVPADGCAVRDLYRITGEFDKLTPSDKMRVLPAMFGVMERLPDADLGSPGPLVHSIETLGIPAYEMLLIESVRRRPMYLNLWMVNRILNGEPDKPQRERLLTLLREVRDDPRWEGVASEVAADFLKHQAEPPS